MTNGQFLGGVILLGLMLAGCGVASWRIASQRLRHLDRLEVALAHSVMVTGFVLLVHIAPMMIGELARGSVLVATALLIAAVWWIPAAAASEPDPPSVRGPRAESDQIMWGTAGIATAVTVCMGLWQIKKWAGRAVTGLDPLTFHLPNVAGWINTGSIWQHDEYLPNFAVGTYPNSGDILLLAAILPFHNDILARFSMVVFYVLLGVAVYALARELRAPAAGGVLAAAVVCSMPIVGLSVIPRSLPDIVLYAMFAIGALFLARHARTDRRSDLVLAGAALGIAFGTKWYGVTSIPLLVVIWASARLAAKHEVKKVAIDFTWMTGLVTAIGGIWLLRNWVEVSNPFYPQRLHPFGVGVFDAPYDPLREQIGHSIWEYKTDPDVLGDLVLEVIEGLGLAPLVVIAAVLLAVIFGGLKRMDRLVLVGVVATLLLTLLYIGTPYTAFGYKDQPVLADVNTRYFVPALVVGAAVLAWMLAKVPKALSIVVQLVCVGTVIAGCIRAFPEVTAPGAVATGVGLACAGAAGWWLWQKTDGFQQKRPLLIGLAVFLGLMVFAQANSSQKRLNRERYFGSDKALDYALKVAPSGKKIGLAGQWSVDGLTPIYPSYGARLDNEVAYVGRFVKHTLREFDARGPFVAKLEKDRYDLLIVGRGLTDPPKNTPAVAWAKSAGWTTVAISDRLEVLKPPGA